MDLHARLAAAGWPRGHLGRVRPVGFLGVHVPIIGAVTFGLPADDAAMGERPGIPGAMLVATPIGTAGTPMARVREDVTRLDGALRTARPAPMRGGAGRQARTSFS
ncbi:MAG: hypothetical protein ACU0BS_03900 [Hasllibacter sp.]